MDLAHQEAILKLVEDTRKAEFVVILGSPNPDSAEIAAETVVNGDPTFAGPLTNVALGLSVYHILEPEVREVIDPAIYQREVGLMEASLPVEDVIAVMRRVRGDEAA